MSNQIMVKKCGHAPEAKCNEPWLVEGPGWRLAQFPTHAEAIAHADRLANPTPPPLTAHGARLTDDAARDFREGL